MTEIRKAEINAISNFLFYKWNFGCVPVSYPTLFRGVVTEYLPTFFRDIEWDCNTEHLVNKWGDLNGDLVRFFAELDSSGRKKLLNWILDNYQGGWKVD